jgi:hypothetical protein
VYASGLIIEPLFRIREAFFKQLVYPVYKKKNAKRKGKEAIWRTITRTSILRTKRDGIVVTYDDGSYAERPFW